MTETPPNRQDLKLPILLLSLIFIVILLSLGVVYYLSAPKQVEIRAELPTATPSFSPTHTPTATITPTSSRTPRPTWTLRPKSIASATATPTQTTTPTATRLPTITPALPYRFNDVYFLNPWTAEAADQAGQLLLGYPDARFPSESQRSNPDYHAAFQFAVYAYKEALMRFPEAPQSVDWQWHLAYSLAQVSDPQAGSLYADLITAALKQGSLRIQDLPDWFSFREPALNLRLSQIPAEPGQLSQSLVEIEQAGISFWLVETPEDIQVYPLIKIANFQPGLRFDHLSTDLTGDGLAEVILVREDTALPTNSPPVVFTLSQKKLVELPLQAALPVNIQTDFQVKLSSEKAGEFTITYTTFPACPVKIRQTYRWDGAAFSPVDSTFQINPQVGLAQYCEPVITHSTNTWEPSVTLEIIKNLLPSWPPPLNSDGMPYPADARDAMTFKMGLYQALTGDQSGSIKTLTDLESAPIKPDSPWIEETRLFLEIYQAPDDLYQACQSISSCDVRAALRQFVNSIHAPDPTTAQEKLRLARVLIRSAGSFDFEQDGDPERWVTIRHRDGQNLEFWILANSSRGVQAIFVQTVEMDGPSPYYSYIGIPASPVVQLEAKHGFRLVRLSKNGDLYVIHTPVKPELTTYTRDSLNAAIEALLSGVDANLVRVDLETVLKSGHFNCINDHICPRFYYTLGLAYELSGNERQAVDTYIKLWWENKNSPYTTIARLKLKFSPPATATPRPTRTPSTALIATQAIEASAFPTSLPSPTPSTPYP